MDGEKYDDGKPSFTLVPPRALLEVAEVLTHGAAKYAPENWRKVEDGRGRYLDASLRHSNAWLRGEQADPESGRHPLAHSIASQLFALELDLQEMEREPGGGHGQEAEDVSA